MRIGLLIGFLALAAVGCAPGGFSARQTAADSTVRIALHDNPAALDPAGAQDVESRSLLQDIYEGLVGYNAQNQIEGVLAESWEISPDGRTYTFHLRPARFHNGNPVTAADVKYSFEHACNPAVASPTAAAYLGDIVGVDDCVAGKSPTISGIEAVDDHTVKISIQAPRPYFLKKLVYLPAMIIPQGTAPGRRINAVKEAIGTGPFRLTHYQADESARLEAFADYHSGAPKIARLERPIIKDAATRLNAYRAGNLDLLSLERQDLPGIQRDPELSKQLVRRPTAGVVYVAMMQKTVPALRKADVRRALAMAINRPRIAKDLFDLPYAPGLIAPGVPGHRPNLDGIPYDPAGARQLLAQAGYPNGRGFPTLTLTYRASRPDSKNFSVAVATDLKQNLGIDVRPLPMEWASLLEKRNTGNLQLVTSSWFADYLDPQNVLSLMLISGAPMNYEQYANPQVDSLLRSADAGKDEAERIKAYQRAEGILLADTARIPVYYTQDEVLISPRLGGAGASGLGALPNAQLEIRR